MLIQIAEDNRNMRDVIKSTLAGLGAQFMESEDGEAAVRDYAAFRPDVVLLDIRMPRMDGLAATRAIRGLKEDACVIVVTQYDDRELRAAALEAGAAAYVLKDHLGLLPELIRSMRATRHPPQPEDDGI